MNSENRNHLKALVAEDEPAMLSLVARHMRSLGFNVVEAAEGDAAWDLAQQHHPDLVVLDVMMPGMSGWEICKRLKGDTSEGRPFAKTGVIMLTGIGENLNEMTSPLFAADAWLNKPFDFSELDAKVRETLARYAKGAAAADSARQGREERSSRSSETPSQETRASSGTAKKKATNASLARDVVTTIGNAAKRSVTKAAKAVVAAAAKLTGSSDDKPKAKSAKPADGKSAPSKPAEKPAAKSAAKTATKPAAKSAAKTATKPAAKTATKSAAKTATKPASKTATKPAAKPSSAKKTASKAAPAKKPAAKAAPSPTKARRSK